MERELKNKIVAITGGAEGIGLSIADQFLSEGAVVVILDINLEKGQNAAKELQSKHGATKVSFLRCDVTTDLESVFNQLIDAHKRVDVLVNNAGIICESSLRKTLEINTVAPIEWTVKFREYMRTDKGGSGGTICNVSSIYGYCLDPYLPYYKASKFALFGFSTTLGHKQNYDRTGVRIVTVCPGFTSSAMTAQLTVWDEHVEEFAAQRSQLKWQTPAQVGTGVAELFRVADSGTAWAIIGGEPIKQVEQRCLK
ncbi:15-hydroxyprostaglandin dehydrogenase [NAD(+)] [Bombyx mori]|uniref:Alcohol dehydrogenase n=1 Tax=Bombyx mori TaxID=7091 RepID=A0A8R2AKQ0_BOMMO|nr:15-hydroxyprostaglandin dehydrogenase [NAD(+)] [Bombyx mori]